MKTFQKIALVSAIAAAPFTSQALEALDDSVLGNTTGQAGVTIDLSIGSEGITIGEIEYIDEGSILLQNLEVGNINNLKIDIDVDAEGNLLVATGGVTGLTVDIGGTHDLSSPTGDFSAVALKGTNGTSELVNNLNLDLNLGASTVSILNLAGANSLASAAEAEFGPDAFAGDVAILVHGEFEITDLDIGLLGETRAQAETRADFEGNDDGVLDADESLVADGYADSAAIKITDVQFYGTGGEGSAVVVDAVVWATSGAGVDGGGLNIQLGSIEGTLDIGGIELGGTSIGQVKISDINLAGMTTRIYGH